MPIKHPATIIAIDGNNVTLNIESKSACAACAAKKSCTMLDCANKTIEVCTKSAKDYKIKQKVQVCMNEKFAWLALFYGYILPLIFVLITLFASYFLSRNELLSATLSLLILPPYYLTLSKLNKTLKTKFQFYIE